MPNTTHTISNTDRHVRVNIRSNEKKKLSKKKSEKKKKERALVISLIVRRRVEYFAPGNNGYYFQGVRLPRPGRCVCKRIKGTGSYAVQTKRRCQKMREGSIEKWWEGDREEEGPMLLFVVLK